MDRRRPNTLDLSACLRLLGLPETASAAQIKRAYRLMAHRFHPDKCGGDDTARRHFVAISGAYRVLMRRARLVGKNTPVGTCCVCGEFREAVVGLDGRARCPDCMLRHGGRPLLPMPAFAVAKCGGAFAVLGVSVLLLVRAGQTGEMAYALGGVAAGLGVMVALAVVCLRVVYCIQPHEESIRRRARDRSRGHLVR